MKRNEVIAAFERDQIFEFVHTDITSDQLEDANRLQAVVDELKALNHRYTSDNVPPGRKVEFIKDLVEIVIDDLNVRYIVVVSGDNVNGWTVVDIYNPTFNSLHAYTLTHAIGRPS